MVQGKSRGKVVVRKAPNKKAAHTGVGMLTWRLLMAISVFVLLLSIFNHYIMGFAWNLDAVCAILLIIDSVYLCYLYRHNVGLFIVMILIAYANYSIAVGVYLFPEIRPMSLYAQFEEETFHIGLNCLLLFVTCLVLWAKKLVNDPKRIGLGQNSGIKYKNNNVIALGAVILYVAIFVFTYTFVEGGRGVSSTITEYRAIILAIGLFYSANNRTWRIVWTVVVASISLLVFLSGNRVDALASIMLLFIFCYSHFLTYKKILMVLPVAVVFLMVVGVARGSDISNFTVRSVLSTLADEKLTWDTPIYAYLPSLSIIELRIFPNLPFGKIDSFLNYLKYSFVGATVDNAEMITISHKYFSHTGGCITPTYFYYWFGYWGTFVVAGLVKLYRRWYEETIRGKLGGFVKELKAILSIYFVSNVARWYCYGPAGLLRNMLVASVVFAIVYWFHALTGSGATLKQRHN